MNTILEDKMQRLDLAKKKYNGTKDRLAKGKSAKDDLESANKGAEGEFKESENMLNEVDKDIRF